MSDIDENRKEEILLHVSEISSGLNNANQAAATQAFINFGSFLQEEFPGMGLGDLRKQIKQLGINVEQELPNLEFVASLSEGKIRAYEEVANAPEPSKNDLYKMDALTKGINLFSLVLGEERFEKALGDVVKNAEEEKLEEDIKNAKQLINGSTYEISIAVTEAARRKMITLNAVTVIRDSIERAQGKIAQQITIDASKNLGLYGGYFEDGKLNVKALVKDVTDSPQSFTLSTELQLAVSSYEALQSLEKTIDLAGSGQEKLINFRDKLNEEPIREALNSNPDDNMTKFLNVMSHILKTIITLSIDHWIEQDPLKSAQQQAYKEALTALKNVEQEEIIPEQPKSFM